MHNLVTLHANLGADWFVDQIAPIYKIIHHSGIAAAACRGKHDVYIIYGKGHQ